VPLAWISEDWLAGFRRVELTDKSPLTKMLDPLTSLSIACSVIQIISFSHEIVSTVKRIKKDGSADPELREHADHLANASKGMEQYLKSCNMSHLSKIQAELQDIAAKCLETSKDIQSTLAEIDSTREATS
jgi:hypothetical protein